MTKDGAQSRRGGTDGLFTKPSKFQAQNLSSPLSCVTCIPLTHAAASFIFSYYSVRITSHFEKKDKNNPAKGFSAMQFHGTDRYYLNPELKDIVNTLITDL